MLLCSLGKHRVPTLRTCINILTLHRLTSNSIRASFWFFLETLRSSDLAVDAAREISTAVTMPETHKSTQTAPPRFNIRNLVRLPLLQSLFSETLRVYVSVMIVRTTRQGCKLGDWAVQKDQKVMLCNYAQHMDESIWNPDGSSPHALENFWGRRFLAGPESEGKPDPSSAAVQTNLPTAQTSLNVPRFAGEGLGAKFFPFGMGERVCPGRHFAKIQTLLTYAVISKSFDIELLVEDGWKPAVDWNHFGYGTMPPAMTTPFRIRRKAACSGI
jgi:cytochrome P450